MNKSKKPEFDLCYLTNETVFALQEEVKRL